MPGKASLAAFAFFLTAIVAVAVSAQTAPPTQKAPATKQIRPLKAPVAPTAPRLPPGAQFQGELPPPPPPPRGPVCVATPAQPDCDGDGDNAIAMGGVDCDDNDPRRAPGRTEIADSENLDEDCDVATFGFRDADSDGYPDARACNWDAHNLRWICGADCDDSRRETNPNQAEVCNSIDDNCDGAIDSGVTTTYYGDADLDGFGDANARIDQCFPPPGSSINANDCNDAVETTHPGQFEIANGVDDNCNGAIDEAPLVGIIR